MDKKEFLPELFGNHKDHVVKVVVGEERKSSESEGLRELYRQVLVEKKLSVCDEAVTEEEDDNDSFITIDSDDEDYNDDSDCTVSNSQSSDSGYNDYNDYSNISYGINPMFTDRGQGEKAGDEFLFIGKEREQNFEEETIASPVIGKDDDKKTHRIVIVNRDTALVCNESILI